MSDHMSIYCEAVACVLKKMLDKELNNEITRENFLTVVKGYRFTSEGYLMAIDMLLLNSCCKLHSLVYEEEIAQLSFLVTILGKDYENIKFILEDMHSNNKKENMH